MKTTRILPAALCALTLISGPAFAQNADAIYSGGDIIIYDIAPIAEALSVKDGKIMAVGTNNEVLRTKDHGAKMTDLGGKTLLPGFIDGHGHHSMVGVQAASATLLPAPDGEGNSIAMLQ